MAHIHTQSNAKLWTSTSKFRHVNCLSKSHRKGRKFPFQKCMVICQKLLQVQMNIRENKNSYKWQKILRLKCTHVKCMTAIKREGKHSLEWREITSYMNEKSLFKEQSLITLICFQDVSMNIQKNKVQIRMQRTATSLKAKKASGQENSIQTRSLQPGRTKPKDEIKVYKIIIQKLGASNKKCSEIKEKGGSFLNGMCFKLQNSLCLSIV